MVSSRARHTSRLSHKSSRALLVLASCMITPFATADVKPARLFSDHMVLQRNAAVPVWGWADPGETVTVSIASHKETATADDKGAWKVKLDTLKAATEPTTMTIAGKNTVTINDVLVGEVWLASGQSNMDFTVSKKVKSFAGTMNEDEEIAAANYPTIRMFTVKQKLSSTVERDVEGAWEVCSPQTVPAFSAVGYFFARELQKEIKVPVGIVTTAWGASTAQCWIGRPALEAEPKFAKIVADYDEAVAKFKQSTGKSDAPRTDDARPEDVSAAPAATAPAAQAKAPKDPRKDQHNPFLLYNGQLAPLVPYAIKGAIWYQGESIVGGTELYQPLMKTLITSWRQEWNQGDFPFLFVQLAAYRAPATQPTESGPIARAREQQLMTLSVPNTAMATAVDIGDAKNVHPKNKQELGRRLALAALGTAYGQPVVYSGPLFDSMEIEGSQVRLTFKHVGGGLTAKGEKLTGFVIAGKDKKFVWADAKIDGDTVVLSSPEVSEPAAVRYAFAGNPACSLYNKEGLPASPFRTDTD